jgi:hypothetical protein
MANTPQVNPPSNEAAEHKVGADKGWMGMTLAIALALGVLVVGMFMINSFREGPDSPLEENKRAAPSNPSVQREDND